MADLRTTYMGLELENPIVMASCGLVAKADGVKKAVDAGAGAVVLKSLFEEQIRAETSQAAEGFVDAHHPEARGYLQTEVWMRYGPRDYCRFIEKSKKAVSVPVIASVNCTTDKWWSAYPKDLEASGADAIELNILVPGTDVEMSGATVERIYIDTVKGVADQVKIPVAAKIGLSFGSLGFVTRELVEAGAKALVLFNRFYQPDIDIDKLKVKAASPFSEPIEMHQSLRWIGLLYGDYDCDLAATTGIHTEEQVIKQLLAGAAVTQVCSTIYKNGFDQIGEIRKGLEEWMGRHDFESVSDFRGKLSERSAKEAVLYERQQYIKHLTSIT